MHRLTILTSHINGKLLAGIMATGVHLFALQSCFAEAQPEAPQPKAQRSEAAKSEATKASEKDKKSSAVNSSDKQVALKELVKSKIEISIEPEDVVSRGRHGLRIRVKNDTDRVLMFSGDKALARVHGTEYKCLGLGEFDDLSGSQPAFIADLISSPNEGKAVRMGSVQSINELLKRPSPKLDRMSTEKKNKETEQSKFGQRILWPGDSGTGTIIFDSGEALNSAILSIPVNAFYDPSDQATASNEK